MIKVSCSCPRYDDGRGGCDGDNDDNKNDNNKQQQQ